MGSPEAYAESPPDSPTDGEEGWTEEGVPPEPLPPPQRSRRTAATLAAVIVVVVVIAGIGVLAYAHLGPFALSPSSSTTQGSGLNYSEAWTSADEAATAYEPGNWSAFLATGIDTPSPVRESMAVPSGLLGASCTATLVASGSVATFDGFDGSLSSGTAPDWFVFAIGPSNDLLAITVIAGQATVWDKFTGSGCAIFSLATLPSQFVDSPSVVASFMQDGGSAYVAAHPGGSLTFGAFGLPGYGWGVDYTTCPPAGSTASGSYYERSAEFDLTQGAAIGTPVEHASATCDGLNLSGGLSEGAGTAPLSAVLSVGPVSATLSAVGVNYTVSVTKAYSGLVWNDLTFSLRNASGQIASGTALDPLTIAGSGGCTIATGFVDGALYAAPSSGGCSLATLGGQARVAAGDTLTIESPELVTSAGANLSIAGSPTYSGTINETLPNESADRIAITTVLSISPVYDGNGSSGPFYQVNVTNAAGGLEWGELTFNILNASGATPSGPYDLNVWSPSGCEIVTGTLNTTAYYTAPLLNACTTAGPTVPVAVGDQVSIPSTSVLPGPGYTWVVAGQNLLSGSITESFAGTTYSLSAALSLGEVVQLNGSLTTSYNYSVDVGATHDGITVDDLALQVAQGGAPVSGPYEVEVADASGCLIATGGVNGVSYSRPTSGACSSGPLGGSAPLASGDVLTVLSSVALDATSDNFEVAGQGGEFTGSIHLALPTGGPLSTGLNFNAPTNGTASGGYYYAVKITKASSDMVADYLGASIENATFQGVSGPYLVNVTGPSGCVVATGAVDSGFQVPSYRVPTTGGCSGVLGGLAPVVVGDSIILYSHVSLSGHGDWFQIYGYGPYYYGNLYHV
jgi:hypothetical protein